MCIFTVALQAQALTLCCSTASTGVDCRENRACCAGLAYLISSVNLHLLLPVMVLAFLYQGAGAWVAGLWTVFVLSW